MMWLPKTTITNYFAVHSGGQMTFDKGRPIAVPKEKRAVFNGLTGIPKYYWPALLLGIVMVSTVIVLDIWH